MVPTFAASLPGILATARESSVGPDPLAALTSKVDATREWLGWWDEARNTLAVQGRARRKGKIVPDWVVTLYEKSPPALLAALVVIGTIGFGQLSSIEGKVDKLDDSIHQTREQMLTSIDSLRGEQNKSLSDVVRSSDQILNAINTRVDRLEQRLKS